MRYVHVVLQVGVPDGEDYDLGELRETVESVVETNTELTAHAVDARELSFDEVEAAGLDGTGRDGDPRFPYTTAHLAG